MYKFTISIAVYSLIYGGFSLICLGLAFKIILDFISTKELKLIPIISFYGQTSIAKYMPGNVMHYVNRHMAAHNVKVNQINMGLASLFEVTVISITAIFYILLSNSLDLTDIKKIYTLIPIENSPLLVIGIGAVIAIILVIFVIKKTIIKHLKLVSKRHTLRAFVRCFTLYSAHFLLSSIILILIIQFLLPSQLPNFSNYLTIGSTYIFSWLIGFIIIGSPGGLGVRESAIILLLSPRFGLEASTMAAIIMRIVTLLGDITMFTISIILNNYKYGPTRAS